MNKIFIDCGGYDGCSVRKFRKLYDKNIEYYIYTFEPNPIFFKYYTNIVNHTLISKACYINNTELIFNLDTKNFDGSSLMEKTNIKKYQSSIFIECIDFVEWFINLVDRLDHNCIIILKMDIEGAEYPILEKLLLYPQYTQHIQQIFIEWHWNRLSNRLYYKNKHNNIVDQLNYLKIPFKHWNAMKYKNIVFEQDKDQ